MTTIRTACLARLNLAPGIQLCRGPNHQPWGFSRRWPVHPSFAEAEVDTGRLDRDLESVIQTGELPQDVLAAAVAYWLFQQDHSVKSRSPWDQTDGWRIGGRASRSIDVEHKGERQTIEGRRSQRPLSSDPGRSTGHPSNCASLTRRPGPSRATARAGA